jgi:hypothetical protein
MPWLIPILGAVAVVGILSAARSGWKLPSGWRSKGDE